MPTLDWIGKSKVVNHHLDVPFCTLEKKYDFPNCHPCETNCHPELDSGSQNMIIHGDNLLALKSLLPQFAGKVKCIYIDPPYNTGNENWVYNDNVNDPKIKKWLGQVVGTEEVDLTRHDKWLCMMYPRLKLLQKLLSDDGAIFISIDDNEQANLKLICDEIFGSRNFVANMIWQSTPGSNTGNDVKTVTEYVTLYAKNKDECDVQVQQIETNDKYKDHDDYFERRGGFVLNKLDRRMTGQHYSDSLNYQIEFPDGTLLYPGHSEKKLEHWNWRWSKDKVQWGIQNGFISFKKNKENKWTIYFKQYEKVNNEDQLIQRSVPYQNLVEIQEANSARGTKEIMDIFNEKKFDYPKPLELISYLLKMYSSPDSIILDSFAGSGTTAHAVLNLNKQDGGNRRFILVEMQDYADSITAERVKRVINGYGEGNKKQEGTGGSFSFYELGQNLFIDDTLNENIESAKIREYVFYTETKCPLQTKQDEPYFMGVHLDCAYYFYYEKSKITTLNNDFLSTLKTKATGYIIYADRCTIGEELLKKYNITFKKIPRDIARL